jgi:hypothetical protein
MHMHRTDTVFLREEKGMWQANNTIHFLIIPGYNRGGQVHEVVTVLAAQLVSERHMIHFLYRRRWRRVEVGLSCDNM